MAQLWEAVGLCPMHSDVSSSANSRVSSESMFTADLVCVGGADIQCASSTATGSSISEWTTDSSTRGSPHLDKSWSRFRRVCRTRELRCCRCDAGR